MGIFRVGIFLEPPIMDKFCNRRFILAHRNGGIKKIIDTSHYALYIGNRFYFSFLFLKSLSWFFSREHVFSDVKP